MNRNDPCDNCGTQLVENRCPKCDGPARPRVKLDTMTKESIREAMRLSNEARISEEKAITQERAARQKAYKKQCRRDDLMDSIRTWGKFVLLYGAMMVVFMGFWVVRSHFEAKAYTARTGVPATTWEAMFLNFQVRTIE